MLVLLSFLCCGSAFGTEEKLSAAVMDEIVVTASREEEPLSRVPANVTVVSEAEIAQSPAETVPELLRGVAGVLVSDVAGNGRNYIVDLRGFGETASLNTLVLIDGRRINQADLSGVDWTLIPKDRVARIEIVRGGGGSVMYGDNATGGVINIITKKGTSELTVNGKLFAGSYETFQTEAFASGEISGVMAAVNGNYRNSNGYRDNSDTEAKDFGLNLSYHFSDRFSLGISGGYHKDDTSLPGALTKSELASGISRTSSLHPDDYADVEDWYLQATPQFFINDNSYMTADISTRKRESKFFSFFDVGEYEGRTDIDTLAFSPRLVLNEQLLGYATNVLLGFDYEKSDEDILNKSIFSGFRSTASYDMSKKTYGYFSHIELALAERFVISGGFRRDKAEFKFKSNDSGTSESNTLDENLYTAGANYQFMNDSSLYASYTKSFRYPVIDESFNFISNTVDSTLDTQTSDDFEIGLRVQTDSGLTLGLNLFRIVTKDEIYYNPAGGPLNFGANENFDGDTIRQGVELFASKELLGILFNSSYTFRDTDIDGGEYDGNELPNVPEHQFSLGAQKQFGNHLLLRLNGTYVGERRFISDFANTQEEMEDYFYLTGKLSYLLEKGSLYVVVNNILDEKYSEYGALNFMGEEGFYPSPEINFLVGVDFTF